MLSELFDLLDYRKGVKRTVSAVGSSASGLRTSTGSRDCCSPRGIRGINVKSQYKTLAADELITGDGHRLPPRLACQIGRELQGLAMVQEQIADLRASLSQSGLRGNPSFAKCGRIPDPTIG